MSDLGKCEDCNGAAKFLCVRQGEDVALCEDCTDATYCDRCEQERSVCGCQHRPYRTGFDEEAA